MHRPARDELAGLCDFISSSTQSGTRVKPGKFNHSHFPEFFLFLKTVLSG
jgi:hypothetical protein